MARSSSSGSYHHKSNRLSSKNNGSSAVIDDRKAVRTVTDPGLLNRTSYTDASVALHHVKKVENQMKTFPRPAQCIV